MMAALISQVSSNQKEKKKMEKKSQHYFKLQWSGISPFPAAQGLEYFKCSMGQTVYSFKYLLWSYYVPGPV